MRQRASSAELLASVDLGDAMSNPLHKKNMDFFQTEFTHRRRKTRFLTRNNWLKASEF
ncbi:MULTISPECIES: hypothetical protein [unclassified Microcoleus]|uniref:hypothetical protein n=1 Tax=unclassified Microcoleus TaxID=2642155 RepID=UPI0025CBFDB9|nr:MULTISPECIES: hypothetical protein [unclassified Microcoleus]